MKPVASIDWRIQALRAAGVRSARAISAALTAEGYTGCSASSVKRRLREPRTWAPTKPVTQPVARPAPQPVTPPPPVDTYVPDDTAIGDHAIAIATLIDQRVDAAVEAELADAESLADRWRNRAELAGWPKCDVCGQHVRPQEETNR